MKNLHPQIFSLNKTQRAMIKHQKPLIIWFTGLSGVGKSTIANLLEVKLHSRGAHTIILDGDNIRYGLNKNLSFTETDRIENIRRVGEVAKLMTEAGLIVICSFISPYAADRELVRSLVAVDEFIEIFLDAPIEVCVSRDPKGLYRRALNGEISNFTGLDQRYERPKSPDLSFSTVELSADKISDIILERIISMNKLIPCCAP